MFIRSGSVAAVCAALLGGVVGCESFSGSNELGPVTPAEKTKATSVRLEKAADVMAKGEKLITEGAAERSKGMAMKQMGSSLDGEKYVANGESKIRQGQSLVKQAREYRKETLAAADRNTEAEPAAYKMQPEVMMPADEKETSSAPAAGEKASDTPKSDKATAAVPPPSQP
jgi:hypothetical protein